MSILPLHSLIFNSKTTIKSHSFASFLPSSSISITTTIITYPVKFYKWGPEKIEYRHTLSLTRGDKETVSGILSARHRKLSQFSIRSSFSSFNKSKENDGDSDDKLISFVDEWGEKSEPELQPVTKLSDSDPPIDVDEWGKPELGSNNSSGIQDEWGEKSFPELRPAKTVSDSDPPIDEDEWVGAKISKKTDRVKIWKSEPDPTKLSESEPQPIVSSPGSAPPEDKDKRVGANLAKPDPTRTHIRITPLSSLVPELGKLVGNRIDGVKNEGVSSNKTTSSVYERGEKSEPKPDPGSDPLEVKDEQVGADLVKPDPTHIAPLSSLVPELGKLVGDRIDGVKNESVSSNKTTSFVEKLKPEPQLVASLLDSDSLKDIVEWGETEVVGKMSAIVLEDERVAELKRRLMDTVYGTDFGLRASSEVRAEALELVAELETANPTPNAVESPELLDGKWILVFTAFSELLPLLAVGTIPLLKVEKISQAISTSSLTIENSTTLSSPIATLSFSATAAFEVRSPSRIQVEFKEGMFKPPEIKFKIVPENMDIFGQNISLSPVQQSLRPLENVVAGIAGTISGLPPLKFPIPGEKTKSWLITTYLDNDLRISRGDGGLFVLVKEESSFLEISRKVLSRVV